MIDFVYKGDDTGAFDNTFITIELDNTSDYVISKAIFVCGKIRKEFDSPEFPLKINLAPEETRLLNYKNVCYLAVFDGNGRKQTCKGFLLFNAEKEVVNE